MPAWPTCLCTQQVSSVLSLSSGVQELLSNTESKLSQPGVKDACPRLLCLAPKLFSFMLDVILLRRSSLVSAALFPHSGARSGDRHFLFPVFIEGLAWQ